MTHSRNKGAAAERELAGLIHDHLGVRLVRNLEQSRAGGHDLVVHPDCTGPVAAWLRLWAVEVKRHAKVSPGLIRAWYAQAQAQAAAAGLHPALAYRPDRGDWQFVLPLAAIQPELEHADAHRITIDMPTFCFLARECCGSSRGRQTAGIAHREVLLG